MKVFGEGPAALAGDSRTAERLGWPCRRRSLPDPDVLLHPVSGDPSREAWIAQGRQAPGEGPGLLWEERGTRWTYLEEAPDLDRYLRAFAAPPRPGGFTVGISGLGRVGGLAASALAAASTGATHIRTLLLHDSDGPNLERMALELGTVASWRRAPLPRVRAATLDEMMRECDAFLFAAARAVPPLGTPGDVRLPQFGPNREALAGALEAARAAAFTGLFLVVSDPVELLAMAAFHDSNVAGGSFTGGGLAPERIGGLALGVMWGRALAAAEALGHGSRVAARGAPYGPHSQEVLVFDDPASPDADLSRAMTEAARGGNYRVRDLGFLPCIGPALSSIVLTLPGLLAGQEVLASSFLDGIYFGAPCRWNWGLVPTSRAMALPVRRKVEDLHGFLGERMVRYGVTFPGVGTAMSVHSGGR